MRSPPIGQMFEILVEKLLHEKLPPATGDQLMEPPGQFHLHLTWQLVVAAVAQCQPVTSQQGNNTNQVLRKKTSESRLHNKRS